ncbi:unnamed protein product [Rotaria sp. Silwood2]|nr:unnamed protein product [Rotaria sp. Silwood2]
MKRFHRNNTFVIEPGHRSTKMHSINSRQHVYWSMASEQWSSDINIWYQRMGSPHDRIKLFSNKNVSIDKFVLHGEFKTLYAGQLVFEIENERFNPRSIWWQIKKNNLPVCQLFEGIVNLFHNDIADQDGFIELYNFNEAINEKVFPFIEKLFNGKIKLADMANLKDIFCSKQIHIRDEVKELLTHLQTVNEQQSKVIPTDERINQISEWFQIYQYHSHIDIIIDCIKRFKILSETDDISIMNTFEQLRSNEECYLEKIVQDYEILNQEFRNIKNKHLNLIKTANECSNLIKIMKTFDLYSKNGRHRFQQLRDNLTIQFQLQERNNMILNSLIIAHALCEPFAIKADTWNEFIVRLVNLSNFEESSLEHLRVVNDNAQIVCLWLTAEETTVFDNALIVMEHLYKTGTVNIHLRHLLNEQSSLEISYSIEKIQTTAINHQNNIEMDSKGEKIDKQQDEIQFTLSMSDIDDHKRQLTFCNVDLHKDMSHMKILLDEQLKLLKIIGDIHSTIIKLETNGHPNYQLIDMHYNIHTKTNQLNSILVKLRENKHSDETDLQNLIQSRTDEFIKIYNRLEREYHDWIDKLEEWRNQSRLLKLFSDRQIMIMIILLTESTSDYDIKNKLFAKLYSTNDTNDINEDQNCKFSINCLAYYLLSLRINDCHISETVIPDLYKKYKLQHGTSIEKFLMNLGRLLDEFFQFTKLTIQRSLSNNSESQQYLVSLNSINPISDRNSSEHTLDIDTFCILLSLLNKQLPSSYQILWCSQTTENDIQLFFSRIRFFPNMIFIIMDIDKMHLRLREVLLNEQDSLTRCREAHGVVYYFSRELTTYQRGLKPFHMTSIHRNSRRVYTELVTLFQKTNCPLPYIHVVCGAAGTDHTLCFSINDKLSLSSLISSLLLLDSQITDDCSSVYFNISIHAPFDELNRALFSLFVCGSLTDPISGLTFSLSTTKRWQCFIEIPYTDEQGMGIDENLDYLLPILAIMTQSSKEIMTNEDYQLCIGKEEELVARFLKAYSDGIINCLEFRGSDEPIKFKELNDENECRRYIYDCINKYSSCRQKNKIYEISFIKFLYRRFQFFTSLLFTLDERIQNLGSEILIQMLNEAKSLAQISFHDDNYSRLYLIYDPGFALHLLHNNWDQVPLGLKKIWRNIDPLTRPEFKDRNHFLKCLSWLIGVEYNVCERVMNEMKFILIENFAYKLLHIHERKLTRLPLIIEGDTGVGKTYLLTFYSLLLNANIFYGDDQLICRTRIIERINLWLLATIVKFFEKKTNLLHEILERLKWKLTGFHQESNEEVNIDDDDHDYSFEEIAVEEKDSSNHTNQQQYISNEVNISLNKPRHDDVFTSSKNTTNSI